jgi:hypothetical protein
MSNGIKAVLAASLLGSAGALAAELDGKVVKVEGNTLYVAHMEAVVPIKLDKNTQWKELKKSELTEGKQIHAAFTVKDQTINLATEIAPSGMGGSGLDPEPTEIDEPSDLERRPGPVPEDPGTQIPSPRF